MDFEVAPWEWTLKEVETPNGRIEVSQTFYINKVALSTRAVFALYRATREFLEKMSDDQQENLPVDWR